MQFVIFPPPSGDSTRALTVSGPVKETYLISSHTRVNKSRDEIGPGTARQFNRQHEMFTLYHKSNVISHLIAVLIFGSKGTGCMDMLFVPTVEVQAKAFTVLLFARG